MTGVQTCALPILGRNKEIELKLYKSEESIKNIKKDLENRKILLIFVVTKLEGNSIG